MGPQQLAHALSNTHEHPYASPTLPDEVWALILSHCSWCGAWAQIQPILLTHPGAAKALHDRADLLVQLLIANGRSPADALVLAAKQGHVAAVEQLLAGGTADWRPHSYWRQTAEEALGQAATHGHLSTVQLLLSSSDYRPRAHDVALAVAAAAGSGHAAIV